MEFSQGLGPLLADALDIPDVVVRSAMPSASSQDIL